MSINHPSRSSIFYQYDTSNGLPYERHLVNQYAEQQGATLFLTPVNGLKGQADTLSTVQGEVFSGPEILTFLNNSINAYNKKSK